MARAQQREATLYDILEVSASASTEEIEASYQRLVDVMGADSLAMYAMLDDGEVERLRAQVDEAYRTLTDPERRAAYDRARTDDAAYPSVMVPEAAGDSNLSVGRVKREGYPMAKEYANDLVTPKDHVAEATRLESVVDEAARQAAVSAETVASETFESEAVLVPPPSVAPVRRRGRRRAVAVCCSPASPST